MKNLRLIICMVAAGWGVIIAFQNCSMRNFQVEELAEVTNNAIPKRAYGKNPTELFMPNVNTGKGTINVGSSGPNGTPAALDVITRGQTGSGPGNTSTSTSPQVGSTGQTNGAVKTKNMNLPSSNNPIKIRAQNGCGSIDGGVNRVVEYHLNTGECGTVVNSFIVSVEGGSLTSAYLCFVRASQVQASNKFAPEKCLFTAEMKPTTMNKLIWVSDNFFAFEGIGFDDFRAEIYSDKEMKSQLGSVDVGLRFPILKDGHFFNVENLEKHPEYGWTSSTGDLVFFPACGVGNVTLTSAWKRYEHPVRDVMGQETSETCYYKIARKQDASSVAKKSCEYAGGVMDGYPCRFESARANHMQSAVAKAISGGTGTIQGTCSDGKWTDVVVQCAPAPKRDCTFNGHIEGHRCVFRGNFAVHGATATSEVLSGGTGSVTGTCNDGEWTNVNVNCNPKASCTFPGGSMPGCRGRFEPARALHGNRQTSYASDSSGAMVGSISAVCNDGQWTDLSRQCD